MKPSQDYPFDMVVIGATGDLARRKLLPALYLLHKNGHLAPDGRIFAAARSELSSADYLDAIAATTREHLGDRFAPDPWREFAARVQYLPLDAVVPASYAPLLALLTQVPVQGGNAVERARIFYLATPPTLYGEISHAIAQAGLVTPSSRIVLEKPIGSDLASATLINQSVGKVFAENQIYRIDHYLGKETVQNLIALRFGNLLFEPLWRAEMIDHVQITVAETLGVEQRALTYDRIGALRDMLQNHLLQLLCLVAMEPPSRLEPEVIREEKIKVLRSLRPILPAEVAAKVVRGQYREGMIAGKSVASYREDLLKETQAEHDSTTETFVALKAEVGNWRWAGVPFYLRTGKRMGWQVSEIVLQFKRVPHLLFTEHGPIEQNRLVIRLQPDESIQLALMMKEPGPGLKLRSRPLDLNLVDPRAPQAYERLLLDAIRGFATLFIHRDEVELAWGWVGSILAAWEDHSDRPRLYPAGTWGPGAATQLMAHDERSWYEHLVDR